MKNDSLTPGQYLESTFRDLLGEDDSSDREGAAQRCADKSSHSVDDSSTSADMTRRLADIEYLFSEHQVHTALERLEQCEAETSQEYVAEIWRSQGWGADKLLGLKRRGSELREVRAEFDDEEGWTYVKRQFGTATYMRKETLNGTNVLWLKMVAHLNDAALMDCIVVWREADLMKQWMPLCTGSVELKHISDVETLCQLIWNSPVLKRDCILHGYGVDLTQETGEVVIIARSVDDYPGVEIPPTKGLFAKRMDLQIKVKITPVSPTDMDVTCIVRIDPKAPLPDMIVNYLIKHFACIILWSMKECALKIRKQGPAKNEHARRMVTKADFYTNWLEPKVNDFFQRKGWVVS